MKEENFSGSSASTRKGFIDRTVHEQNLKNCTGVSFKAYFVWVCVGACECVYMCDCVCL